MAELPKSYDAKVTDAKWYQFWQDRHFFKAQANSPKQAYCIVMPPPNITGALHMGHALVNTLQDILIRWKRMQGYEALWIPGTDHASIATETMVEQHLIRTTGKRKREHTREEFLKHVWQWKEKHEERIVKQLQSLGCSCDWSRQRFTMDEGSNLAVRKIFKKLFDDGLIYRGDYLINWDPITQTALADDEIEHEDLSSFLWYIRYPLQEGVESLTIATTRPETLLGDTAIAVHPKDERYQHLIGKKAKLPLINRLIPIIADHSVDPAFGTGAVKITPAHDHNDYQMGLTHQLEMINIMTPDGKINENGGDFVGQSMQEARQNVVAALKEANLLVKIEPHEQRIGLSYRSKAIIEPYLSKQWFVRMSGFAKRLRQVIENREVKLIPENWQSTYYHWIDNLRDWCISRQLWWGHRIPIWYRKEDPNQMICYDGEEMPNEVRLDPEAWQQDPDALDTWFSSALWPFSTLGWPEENADFAKFYPTAVLITGHDILFFWVARMIIMGDYATSAVPFPETFLHGLIYGKSYWRQKAEGGIAYVTDQERIAYDLGKPVPKEVCSKWEKMSKTKGNVIDPLEMIEQYGTDATRMALCASATQARQIDLDRRRFEEFKNFSNKIWNGARFVLMNLQANEEQGLSALTSLEFAKGFVDTDLQLEDRWILSKMNSAVKQVNYFLQNYQFDQAASLAYDFFWKDFCAYYLELCKPYLFGKTGSSIQRLIKQKLLVIVLSQAIRLIHPMAPFITEELFQLLKNQLPDLALASYSDPYTSECVKALQSPSCIVAAYPKVVKEADINTEVDQAFEVMQQVIYTIRNLRGEMKVSSTVATNIEIVGRSDDADWQIIQNNIAMIYAMIRTEKVEVIHQESGIKISSTGVFRGLKVILPLPQEMVPQEKLRLKKEKEKLVVLFDKTKGQLSNEEFVQRAPQALVDKLQLQLKATEKELKEIEEKLQNL